MWSESPLPPTARAFNAVFEDDEPEEAVATPPPTPGGIDIWQGHWTPHTHTPGGTTWRAPAGACMAGDLLMWFIVASNDGTITNPPGTTLAGSGSSGGMQWLVFSQSATADYQPDIIGACSASLTDMYGIRIRFDGLGATAVPTAAAAHYASGASVTLPGSSAQYTPWTIAACLSASRGANLVVAPPGDPFNWTYWGDRDAGGSWMVGSCYPTSGPSTATLTYNAGDWVTLKMGLVSP